MSGAPGDAAGASWLKGRHPIPRLSAVVDSAEFQLRRDLPDDAAAQRAATSSTAVVRRPVEITVSIKRDTRNRVPSVQAASEIVEIGIDPTTAGWHQLENIAVPDRKSTRLNS